MKAGRLPEIGHGDLVEARFLPPVEVEEVGEVEHTVGTVACVAGMYFIASTSHRTSSGMPRVIELPADGSCEIEVLETSSEAKERKRIEARGEVVFSNQPGCAAELEEQLDHLALMIARETDDHVIHGRKGQLRRQFDDLADTVRLARRKRTYIQSRAIIGHDFHPWTIREDRVFRIETVRPLPADFEIDPWARKDRARRRDEAIRIFGEAERETREWISFLRGRGYAVRRPHPNAQEILVRADLGIGKTWDLIIAPSANGLWEVDPKPPQNKREAKLRAACMRQGHRVRLQEDMEEK
ncbi:hypothetical protein [Roseivivax sp. CAU 1761]